MNVFLESNTDKRSVSVKTSRSLTGSSLLGSVCMSCFVIPANWPSLHPTLAYQGTARRGKQTIVVDGTLW